MRSTRSIYTLAMALVALTLCGGCSSDPPAKDYATIRPDPRRDVEAARRHNAVAIKFIDEGKWGVAEQALRNALEADVTFGPAHNNLGRVYYQQRKFYLAAWEFQYAVKLMPYAPEPKNNLGLVLEETGKLDEAVKEYDGALAIQPDNPELIGNAARVRVRRGDRDNRTRELLVRSASNDTREAWSEWAKQQLVIMRPTTPATQGAPLP